MPIPCAGPLQAPPPAALPRPQHRRKHRRRPWWTKATAKESSLQAYFDVEASSQSASGSYARSRLMLHTQVCVTVLALSILSNLH